ncbi:EcsC family protein [Acidipropionibacterium acidipropionici]|uniref:EcsC family protein n=1 Tax=Acidipropionibacterium acidipropionici TaxID=1748 RepID=UPI0004106D61|nr:EcsC family protein [Acidipropionibacterium acidipropionici]ALN14489.1 hypothetical protein ASQ49_03490 [Acidipropionibacterium acidipropionici]APZ09752.1 hypothetical protein BWX38_11435 [Acidipropionibacterium acidipropionici]
MTETALPPMDAYDLQVWRVLNQYWEHKNDSRALPNRVTAALERGGAAAGKAVKKAVGTVPEVVREPIRRAGETVTVAALRPTVQAATSLLDLVNAWSLELNDPKSVEKRAQKQGLDIETFVDLRDADLKACDRLLTFDTLTWRSFGALEGGAMGALAMVPVAGLPTSIGADVVVIQVLSTAIAARVAYSYGFDARDPREEEFIQRLVTRSFKKQAAKAVPMREAAQAAHAVKGRVRWSSKLRGDHKLVAALERVMNQAGVNGGKVSVKTVGKAVPFVGIVLGAGVNSAVLGSVAADAKRYCQTRYLCEKYGLPLPESLTEKGDDDVAEEPEPGK